MVHHPAISSTYVSKYVEPWVNKFIRWKFMNFIPKNIAAVIRERPDELEYTSGDPAQHTRGPYNTAHVDVWARGEDLKPVLAQWHLAGVVNNTRAALLQLFGTQDLLGSRVLTRRAVVQRSPFLPSKGNCCSSLLEEANAETCCNPRFCKLCLKCRCCNSEDTVNVRNWLCAASLF